MPKEIIYSAGAASDDEGGYHAKVGWTAEREVQIGVEANGGRSLFWMLTSCGDCEDPDVAEARAGRLGGYLRTAITENGRPAEELSDAGLARTVLNALDRSTNGPFAGVWVDLDRAGCNKLIRSLRKARDQAYGRDE